MTPSSRLSLRAAYIGAEYASALPYLTTHYGADSHSVAMLGRCADAARCNARVRTMLYTKTMITRVAPLGVWRFASWSYS